MYVKVKKDKFLCTFDSFDDGTHLMIKRCIVAGLVSTGGVGGVIDYPLLMLEVRGLSFCSEAKTLIWLWHSSLASNVASENFERYKNLVVKSKQERSFSEPS